MKGLGFRVLVHGLRVEHAHIRGSGLKVGGRTDAGWDFDHVSHSVNSLKGGYIGDYIGDYYRGY